MDNPRQENQGYRLLVYQNTDSSLVLRREFSNIDDVLKFIHDFKGIKHRFLIAENKSDNTSNNYLIINAAPDFLEGLTTNPLYYAEGFRPSSVVKKNYILTELKLRVPPPQEDKLSSNEIVEEYRRQEHEKKEKGYQTLALADLDINLRQPIYTALQNTKWIDEHHNIKIEDEKHKNDKKGHNKYVQIETLLKMLSDKEITKSMAKYQQSGATYSKAYQLMEHEILYQVAKVIIASDEYTSFLSTSNVTKKLNETLKVTGMFSIYQKIYDKEKKREEEAKKPAPKLVRKRILTPL